MFPIVRWVFWDFFCFVSRRESVNLHLDDESKGKEGKGPVFALVALLTAEDSAGVEGDGGGVKACAWPPLEGMDTEREPELGVALVCPRTSPPPPTEMCIDLNKRSAALKNEKENHPAVELHILFKF